MVTQGITVKTMAKRVGMAPSKVSTIRCGYTMPRQDHLVAIANELSDPGVIDTAKEYLETTCHQCGKTFLRNPSFQRGDQKFCSTICRSRFWNDKVKQERKMSARGRVISARRRETEALGKVDELEEELERVHTDIARFCKSCEWDEVCKDDTCELRDWSPFPYKGE